MELAERACLHLSGLARVQERVSASTRPQLEIGSLRRARELEALGVLAITLAAGERISWTGGVALIP